MSVHVLVVAAGRGTRAGPGGPKQYRALAGRPVLTRTLEALARAAGPDILPGAPPVTLRVVIHPDDRAAYAEAAGRADLGGLRLDPPVIGGPTRQDSVRLGLEALEAAPGDRVLIHDAARPFVAPRLVADLLAALETAEGACPALPVADTLRRDSQGRAGEVVDRAGLVRAQTPQGFRFGPALGAHRGAAGRNFTDDVAVALAAGLRVSHTEGDPGNVKLTTPADLAAAEARLTAEGRMEFRTGTGFDVHALTEGDGVTLCGVRIPFSRALKGHSDADVGLHALTDAIFGALAEGDIGRWFPPDDPRWKGAPSRIFLETAVERVAARGGRLVHVDVTLICEAPRIGPHSDAMRSSLAETLRIPVDRVSVKATTTERLGFAGRGEGIAAQAAATLALPAPERPQEP